MASPLYDIKFTIGATDYGFMLVSPKGQSKQMDIQEIGGPSADRISTAAAANHQDFSPDKDTPFAMSGFGGGAGQLEADDGFEDRYWWSSGVVTRGGKAYLPVAMNTLALASSTGDISGFLHYVTSAGVGYDFCWEGPRLFRRVVDDDTTAWILVYTASDPITSFQVFNGNGLIAVPAKTGTTDFFVQTDITDGATWTPTAKLHSVFDDTEGKPVRFLVNRGTCYALVDNNKVYYTVDPAADDWIGPIEITVGATTNPETGDATYPWVNASTANDYLVVFKQDAGYNIDANQNVSETFWQWRNQPNPANFKYVASGSGLLYFSVGASVYAYDPTTGQSIDVGVSKQDGFSVQEILGVAADNRSVYILAQIMVPTLRSAASVALLRAIRVSGSKWAYEVLWEDTDLTDPDTQTYGQLAALPDNGMGTRVFFGRNDTGTTDTMFLHLPPDWDESAEGALATAGSLWTSLSRSGFANFVKRHLWTSMETEDHDANNTVTIHYSTDNGVTFSSLGTTVAGTALTQLSYSDVSSRSIVLRFDFVGDGTETPILRVFDHHQRVRFRYLQALTAMVRIADKIERLNSTRDPQTKEVLWANLETLRTSDSQITYTDFLGNSFVVSMDNVVLRPTRHEKPEDSYEMEAMISFARADKGA